MDQKLADIFTALDRTPTGRVLNDYRRQRNIEVNPNLTGKSIGQYSFVDHVVFLNMSHPTHILVGTLAHELLHAWQEDQGIEKNGVTYYESIFNNRMIEVSAAALGELVRAEHHNVSCRKLFNLRAKKECPINKVQTTLQHFVDNCLPPYDQKIENIIHDVVKEYGVDKDNLPPDLKAFFKEPDQINISEKRAAELTAAYGLLPNGENFLVKNGGIPTNILKKLAAPKPLKL